MDDALSCYQGSETCANKKPIVLTFQQLAALHELFHRHCGGATANAHQFDFEGFKAAVLDAKLIASCGRQEELIKVFARAAVVATEDASADTFEQFCLWMASSDSDAAMALKVNLLDEDASLSAAVVRTFTNLTRPLAAAAYKAILQLKFGFAMKTKSFLAAVSQKVAAALKTSMKNPTKLFTRHALSPLEAFQHHPAGLLHALRAEFAAGGIRSISTKAMGPYVLNSFVAVSMFHTYTASRMMLHGATLASETGDSTQPLLCEMMAGAAAGTVQATLTTPLHNLKLLRKSSRSAVAHVPSPSFFKSSGIFAQLVALHQYSGIMGMYRNYPYVLVQEVCSLACFFTSFELIKAQAIAAVRHHVDPSGDRDLLGKLLAASGAGVVLVAVGTPFENVFEWHSSRRTASTPHGVLAHFYRDARARSRMRILLSGMKYKLPLAPLAGLPLLAYDVMMHNGLAPVIDSMND